MFFNGAQGDVNHVNVHPVGGDANGLHPCFDDADRGYAHAKHMGRVIAVRFCRYMKRCSSAMWTASALPSGL